jgi:hypothetical protein
VIVNMITKSQSVYYWFLAKCTLIISEIRITIARIMKKTGKQSAKKEYVILSIHGEDKKVTVDSYHDFIQRLIDAGVAQRVDAPIFNFDFKKIAECAGKQGNRKYHLLDGIK